MFIPPPYQSPTSVFFIQQSTQNSISMPPLAARRNEMFSTPACWRKDMGSRSPLIRIGTAIDLGVMVAALPEGDRERIVECEGAVGPWAGAGADRSDLVQLGGRTVAVGMPATLGTGLGRKIRAKIPAAAALGLRPQDAPRRRAAGRAEPVRRGPYASVPCCRIHRIGFPAGAGRLVDQNPRPDRKAACAVDLDRRLPLRGVGGQRSRAAAHTGRISRCCRIGPAVVVVGGNGAINIIADPPFGQAFLLDALVPHSPPG